MNICCCIKMSITIHWVTGLWRDLSGEPDWAFPSLSHRALECGEPDWAFLTLSHWAVEGPGWGARLSILYTESLCCVHSCLGVGSANPCWACRVRLSPLYAESPCCVHIGGWVRLSKSLLSLWSSGSANPCWDGGAGAQQILADLVGVQLDQLVLSCVSQTWHSVICHVRSLSQRSSSEHWCWVSCQRVVGLRSVSAEPRD